VDLYLDLPVENEEELRDLAKAANHATDRMIKNLDETVAYVDRVLKRRRNGKCAGHETRRPFGKSFLSKAGWHR